MDNNVYGKLCMCGYLEKGISSLASSSSLSYRSQYFVVDDGRIEYYSKEPCFINRLSLDNNNDRSSSSSSYGDDEILGYMELLGSIVTLNSQEITIVGAQFNINNYIPPPNTTTGTKKNYTIEKLKPDMILRVPNVQEALAWYDCIQKNIDNSNIIALRSGSRLPEVVEWYYRYQHEVNLRTTLLENEQYADMHYTLPIKSNNNTDSQWKTTSLSISMPKERKGLIFKIRDNENTSSRLSDKEDKDTPSKAKNSRKKLDFIENSYNGRLISLSDITDINMKPTVRNADQRKSEADFNSIYFSLITKEGEVLLEMGKGGVAWIRALNDVITFARIPIPPSKTTASPQPSTIAINNNNNGWRSFSVDAPTTTRDSSGRGSTSLKVKVGGYSDMASNYMAFPQYEQRHTFTSFPNIRGGESSKIDFSANSGTVFTCSGDVAMILDQLAAQPTVVPGINAAAKEISTRANVLLKLLTEVKVNKEAAAEFGDRLQDMIRLIGEPHAGLLTKLKSNDYNNIQVQLINFCGKLSEAANFIETQVSIGWFVNALNKKGNAKMKYYSLDFEMIAIVNSMISHLLGQNPTNSNIKLFEKKSYDNAIDIRKSVDALGGVDFIYSDPAKARALARLIQADGADVAAELKSIMGHGNDNDSPEQRRVKTSKLRYPFFKNSYQPMRKKDGYGRLRYYCCWCFKGGKDSLLSDTTFFSNISHDQQSGGGGLQGLGLGLKRNPILDLDDPLL